MKSPAHLLSALALTLSALAAGCSSGSGNSAGQPSGGVGSMAILSCSLGCNVTGGTVSCGSKAVFRNETIAVEFNQAVLPSSVNKNTIKVLDDQTGSVPLGSYEVDPTNPKRVFFRPSLTFDSQGNPIFGFRAGASYTVTINGTDQVQGPASDFIRSTSGKVNSTTMECYVAATLGVRDLKPGAPTARVFYDVVTATDPITGEVTGVDREVLANGAVELEDVYRDTVIKLEFDDIMNPSTVVNPVTGKASLIQVFIDGDGDVNTDADRVQVFGSWLINLDQDALTTSAFFYPQEGLPSAGLDPGMPRLLVVNLPVGVADLGDNTLINSGPVAGALEFFFFDEVFLPGGDGEDFATTEFRDDLRTGAHWGPADLGGSLINAMTPGLGGGSGRLGDLVVRPIDSPFVLNTDEEAFPPGNLVDNYDPITGMPAAGEESYTVEGGVFEFASVTIQPGATLRFEGTQPARIYARGGMVMQGLIDVAGADVGPQDSLPCDVTVTDETDPRYCFFLEDGFDPGSMDPEEYADLFRGGRGAPGGPAGGAGGNGGDLSDGDYADPLGTLLVKSFPDDLGARGLDNPNAEIVLDGTTGEGVPAFDNPGVLVGGGAGGPVFPDPFPVDDSDLGGLIIDNDTDQCFARYAPVSGGGGANATIGGAGQTGFHGAGAPKAADYGPAPPDAAGGDASLGFTPAAKSLDPNLGYLRGGAGGGGSGAGVANTLLNGNLQTGCLTVPAGTPLIADFIQNMGAAGGGGGGAVQIQAAARLVLDGVIDATGGEGGQRSTFGGRMSYVGAGGSGAGGNVLLQSEQLELAGLPDRILVNGGDSARGAGKKNVGGEGGSGRVRVESGTTPETLLTFSAVDARIQPDEDARDKLPGKPSAQDVLSVVNFERQEGDPGRLSGGQSCWLKPVGNVFFVSFFEDDGDELGWDMDIFVSDIGESVSWREVGALFPGKSVEDVVGSDLGDGRFVVRFQGARAISPIPNLCDVDITGSAILSSSLTPWVRHPAELNDFFENEQLRPNLIRYQIIFDESNEFASQFTGVTSVKIRAQGE